MPAYISVVFEKAQLVTSEQVRVIVRNRDDGSVPPAPSPVHFPTQPNALQNFIVGQYISSVTGESFTRIATTSDLNTYSTLPLNTLEDQNVDFIAAGVSAGNILTINLADPELWTSTEYPGTNPFSFSVAAVLSSTAIRVVQPFPAFLNSVEWEIATASLSSATGVTRRNGLPSAGTYFLDRRFNRIFPTVVEAENAVVAMKADITALTNETVGDTLTTETVTLSATI